NQGLWRSTDGKAWSQLSVASNKSFYHIYTDKGVWIACCVGGMYKSTDNGANWSPCTIDVDSTRLSTMIFMVSFHINKSWIEGGNLDGFWLAGSSDGIFYSADGTKWSCALDLANSNFSSFAYNGLERIVATKSLYGNGLWYSDYTLALQD
ncbi:MAG: hypothetical protein IKB72_04495, partial [Ruminococcus sp.]|nr:hypothetical protein [Ruminococcus sp.]